ncbi:hypothetical protein TSOC_013704, partial [Tetrabaena socialis]
VERERQRLQQRSPGAAASDGGGDGGAGPAAAGGDAGAADGSAGGASASSGRSSGEWGHHGVGAGAGGGSHSTEPGRVAAASGRTAPAATAEGGAGSAPPREAADRSVPSDVDVTAEGAATEGADEEGEEEEGLEEEEEDTGRTTTVSRLLQLVIVGVFVAQWAPVAQAAAAGAATMPAGELVVAALLACPPTPMTVSWQADALSLASGQLGCILTSSVLHSGLLSLVVSLVSLEETAPWLETLHGFMIMLISYGLAGAGAVAAQMFLGNQAASIAGIGAALGMEAAVSVRTWRTDGEVPGISLPCLLLGCTGALMAVGVLGGLVGGALSGVLAYDILWLMRIVLAFALALGVGTWKVVTWAPRMLWRVLSVAAALVVGTAVGVVQAMRGV